MECVLIVSDYELAGLEQAAVSLITDINLGKSFVRSIEETIRQGLIWKRLIEETSKTDKSQGFVKSIKNLEVKRKRLEGKKKREEKITEELRQADGVSSVVIEKDVIYTHSADWAAPTKTSLKKLLHSDEAHQQEITAESISAEVDGCRGDPNLHEKIFGDLKLRDQSSDQINLAKFSASVKENNFPEPNLFQPRNPVALFIRNFHTVGKKKSNFEERNLRRRKQDNFKQYIMEDRRKIQEHAKPPEKLEQTDEKVDKLKSMKAVIFEESPKFLPWEERLLQSHYKCLNVAAKQKIRNYNARKKFNPSASVLLMLEKRRREKAEKSLITAIQERSEKKFQEYKKKIQEEEADRKGEIEKNERDEVPLTIGGKDENAKYREFVLKQLDVLKKENESLKKRLMEISRGKQLETALQVQSDRLELERTKLKACWLIMTSTMEAFSNFCKKFTSKTNSKSLQKAVQEIEADEDEESEEEEYEDALDHIPSEEKKGVKEDDKYFQFLQELMEDQMGSKKMRKSLKIGGKGRGRRRGKRPHNKRK